jgi:L-lactate dehydrogenase complex protein LldE
LEELRALAAERPLRVALFATCIVDAMYPRVAHATVAILRRLGHEVIFPAGQACCGQMHVNTGKFEQAYGVVKNHVEAFEADEYDVAVAPSGSCVMSVKHQQPMIAERAGDQALADRAACVGARTLELSQLLVDVLGITNAAEQLGSYFPHTLTYHPSCHGMRLLRLDSRQEDLLKTVAGVDFRPLPEADQCCGFGGTFSVKNSDVSGAMLADKAENICSTGASAVAGGDVSCLMHIGGGLSRRKAGVGALHLAEVLASTRENPLNPSEEVNA